ncbi:MAG: ABC transporter permease [Cyclobacteriaceae bacterium]
MNIRSSPPKPLLRFFRWFCHPELHPFIEGDLLELYEERVKEQGKKKANVRFAGDVLLLFRPSIIRSFNLFQPTNHRAMLRHNLLLTFRNFQRYKSTFLINLIGLSSGLACALLIFLWVQDELNVDKFHANDDQLYQVLHNIPTSEGILTTETTQGLLAETLIQEMPEVAYATPVVPSSWFSSGGVLSLNDIHIKANAQYIGQDFFNIFTCKFTTGSQQELLNTKYAVAISEEVAQKLFKPGEEIIGKVIHWNKENLSGDFAIAGIFSSPPSNATDQYDLLFNYELFFEARPFLTDWQNSDPSTYLILKEGVNLEQLNEKLTSLLHTKNPETDHTLFVQKYSDRYLRGHYENGVPTGGRIEYVRLFSIIAIFILLIACINFMNLSTARASRRAKEIGVKKAIGVGRNALIVQHITESTVVVGFSLVLAMLLVVLFLPQFNTITSKQLTLNFTLNQGLSVLGILIVTSLLAGSYPALFLSGFNPMAILRGGGTSGQLTTSLGERWIRTGLVVFQFTLSILLITSVLVVYHQVEFIQAKNLGYSRDNVIYFEVESKASGTGELSEESLMEQQVETFLYAMETMPGVVQASNACHDLTGDHGGISGVDWEPGDQDRALTFGNLEVGYGFIETLGISLVAGRPFSRNFSSESSKIIINERAAEVIGFTDPVGKTIRIWGQEREIIGVVQDFHYESLYEEVRPCFFRLFPGCETILARIEAGKEKETIDLLGKLYQQQYPQLAFEYRFLDEDYQALYAAEQRVSTLSRYFAGLAILISCLGLFGLAAFTAERRIKEIGIRKALGASVTSIVQLLSGDFTKMVLVAIAVALPISYFVAKHWLQSFAFHIDLQWWYFAGAGFLALLIAWFTVGLQTVKAAQVNPVECLKDE